MRNFILFFLCISSTFGCLNVRKVNDCGCFDYNRLTLNRILNLESTFDVAGANWTLPIYTYVNDCTYIYASCPEDLGTLRTLIKTNWPERDLLYTVNMVSNTRTSTLFFNVKCDKKSHEWKYTDVDDEEREIVNEYLICRYK